MNGYAKCTCDRYEPGSDGLCLDMECGHDGDQHVVDVGPNEACAAQEGDPPGSYLPFEEPDPS